MAVKSTDRSGVHCDSIWNKVGKRYKEGLKWPSKAESMNESSE